MNEEIAFYVVTNLGRLKQCKVTEQTHQSTNTDQLPYDSKRKVVATFQPEQSVLLHGAKLFIKQKLAWSLDFNLVHGMAMDLTPGSVLTITTDLKFSFSVDKNGMEIGS